MSWQYEAFVLTVEEAKKAGGMREDGPLGREHVVGMLERITPDFSPSKLGRWLGWAQAAVVASGALTLDDVKRINMECSARERP